MKKTKAKKRPKNVVKVGAVAIIIDGKKRILLVKRRGKSHEGFWALPAETIRPDETIKKALIRGMREELGIEIKILKYTGHYYDSPGRDERYKTAIDHPFLCKIKKGNPKAREECSEIKWFRLKELKNLHFPFDQGKMLQDSGMIH